MTRRNSDLAVMVATSLLVVGLSLLGALPRADGLGLGLVLPFVVVCPGWALLAALGVERIDTLTRAIAVLAVGLAWTVLVGLLLHATPLGVGGSSFAAVLAAVVVGLAALAVRTRRHAAAEPPSSPPDDGGRPAPRPSVGLVPRLLFVVAGCLAASAVALAVFGAHYVGQPAFTQLWAASTDEGDAIRVGVHNLERQPMTYELRLRIGDEPWQTWHSLSVAPEQTWEDTVAMPSSTQPVAVELALVRSDRPAEVYRLVRIWPRSAASIRPF